MERKQKTRILQLQFPKFHKLSHSSQCLLNTTHSIFADFTNRLRRTTEIRSDQQVAAYRPTECQPPPPPKSVTQYLSTLSTAAEQPDGVTLQLSELEQPVYDSKSTRRVPSRRHAQSYILSGRNTPFAVIDEKVVSEFQDTTQQSRPTLSDSGRTSSGYQSQTDVSTVITSYSSSRKDSTSVISSPNSSLGLQHEFDKSEKIVVETLAYTGNQPPTSLEKSYPEVAVLPADCDTFSITSDNSLPQTVHTVKNPLSRSRWGGLLKGKKDTSTFVLPRFRFFASGKHIILWTKFGGGIIDPSQAPGQDFVSIHEADIVHAAGGTYNYVVIARSAEVGKPY